MDGPRLIFEAAPDGRVTYNPTASDAKGVSVALKSTKTRLEIRYVEGDGEIDIMNCKKGPDAPHGA
jgi:hypothetical protein